MAASPNAWPRNLDAQALRDYGGSYMVDCKNNASAKATVFAGALVFLHGDQRLASNSIETGYAYFHPNPSPKGFLVTLINTGPGGMEMLWHVFRDASGQYMVFADADVKTTAVIGKALAKEKFRRCDGAPATKVVSPPAPTPTQAQRTYALHELSAPGLLMDTKAKALYYNALGSLRREDWLARLDGPSPQNKLVTVLGTRYLLAGACKNHDCYDNSIALLYSEAQGV
ncbi:MAG: Ivy family c-type lysozyme inhibitor, partial [Burkholderiaceae bacterium]